MASELATNMVLRTVYLPPELDQALRIAAFRDERSKNDIIRELIQSAIDARVQAGDKRFLTNPVPSSASPVLVGSLHRVTPRAVSQKAAPRLTPARKAARGLTKRKQK